MVSVRRPSPSMKQGAISAAIAVSAAEIAPCFTDTVVLACTHYPLLLDRFERLAPWPVSFLDPAPAIARRVVDLIGPPGPERPRAAQFVYSSGRPPSLDLAAALARFGIAP